MIKVTELKSLIGTDGGLTVELTPFLNKEFPESLYSQLYHWIKKEIEEGRLLPGMKMPSIRQLTTHLKVSRNTVEAAYQQLQSEGYLESIPKSGIWVAEIEKPSLHPIEKIHPIRSECKPSSEVLVDFVYGNVDLDKFPVKQWKKCLSDAVDQENNWLFEYSEKQGEFALRREISNYLLQSRGVRCIPEQIVITSGTQTSMALICRLLELREKSSWSWKNQVIVEYNSVFKDQGCI